MDSVQPVMPSLKGKEEEGKRGIWQTSMRRARKGGATGGDLICGRVQGGTYRPSEARSRCRPMASPTASRYSLPGWCPKVEKLAVRRGGRGDRGRGRGEGGHSETGHTQDGTRDNGPRDGAVSDNEC